MNSKTAHLALVTLLALTTIANANFFNGFENEGDINYGWNGIERRVDTTEPGYSSIPAAGGDWYAETMTTDAYTFWGVGGYNADWAGGFTTSIDLYLTAVSTGSQFSWTSAIANNVPDSVVDTYAITGSFSESDSEYFFDVTDSASNGPTTTGTQSTINTAGWYTLEHTFYEYDDSGLLSVDLSILNDDGILLESWTFDTLYSIGDLGGSAYGRLDVYNSTFAIDNTSMKTAVVPVPGALLLAGVGLSCAGLHLRKRRT